jgi:hypothetical protein
MPGPGKIFKLKPKLKKVLELKLEFILYYFI